MLVAPVQRLRLLNNLVQLDRDIVQNQAAIACQAQDEAGRGRRRRRYWIRPWVMRRPVLGQYERLMQELQDEDVPAFRNFVRIEPAMSREFLERVGPRITKQDTFCRRALDPGLKLAMSVRYAASGDSYHSLMYGFRVAHNTISLVVRDVCEAIIEEYSQEVISCPTTPDEWRAFAEQFKNRWQFPNAVCAMDGKHVAIRCPRKAGSMYYSYKGFHSIVFLALVDADYKFIWVDVGSNGSASDAQIFNQCELRHAIEDGTIGFPPPHPLPGDDRPTTILYHSRLCLPATHVANEALQQPQHG